MEKSTCVLEERNPTGALLGFCRLPVMPSAKHSSTCCYCQNTSTASSTHFMGGSTVEEGDKEGLAPFFNLAGGKSGLPLDQ